MEEFVKLLADLQINNNDLRDAAERKYEAALIQDPNSVVSHQVALLISQDGQGNDQLLTARNFAGVLFRRVMLDGDSVLWREKFTRETKLRVTSELLSAFEREQNEKICRRLGVCMYQVATAISRSEERDVFWPDLLPCLLRTVSQGSEAQQAAAIDCIGQCIDIHQMKLLLTARAKELSEVIELAFRSASATIRKEGCILVALMIEKWERKKIRVLEKALNPMIGILTNLVEEGRHDDTSEVLQQIDSAVQRKPEFFKSVFASLMTTLQKFVAARNTIDDELRRLSLELILSMAECSKSAKHMWRHSSVMPTFPHLALSCCMEMMVDILDDNNWSTRMDDEEDDDEQENFNAGDSGIDRVVEALSIEHCQKPLVELIQQYVNQEHWEAKHAALSCIRQCVEYVEDKEVVEGMAELVFRHTDHTNKRLRYVAWLALAQMSTDQAPEFQEKWHPRLMPAIARSMEHDPELRVQQMTLSCFVAFGEELDHTDMDTYVHHMMSKLVNMIMSITHRGVREEAITSIAVIAGVIENEFEKYYDGCLRILKDCMTHCTDPKESRLRGKAFECVSLLGHTVAPERFREDAGVALEVMCKTYQNPQTDDVQKDYIKESMERMCRILKNEFSPYLHFVVPPLLQIVDVKKYADVNSSVVREDEDNLGMTITYENESFTISEAQLTEINNAVGMISVIIEETAFGYLIEVERTAATLDPWLKPPHQAMLTSVAETVRETIFECWSGMVKSCALVATDTAGANCEKAAELGNNILRRFFEIVVEAWTRRLQEIASGQLLTVDCDDVKLYGSGLANCIGGGVGLKGLSKNEIEGLIALTFRMIKVITDEERQIRVSAAEEDDEADDDCLEELYEANTSCKEVLGKLMQYDPTAFNGEPLAQLGEFLRTLDTDIENDQLLMLSFAADLVEYLGDASVPLWQIFINRMMEALHDSSAELRQVAAYVVNICSRGRHLDLFPNMATTAYLKLISAITGKKKFAKKREDASKMAMDNMIAALVQVVVHHPDACAADTWDQILANLPLLADVVEGKKVHAEILRLLKTQHTGMLGPNNMRTAKVIGILAEVYDGTTCKQLSKDIKETFALIPIENWRAIGSELKERHRKKIERVLKE